MVKLFSILILLLLPLVSSLAQVRPPKDTSVATATLTEDPADMARAEAKEKKAVEVMREEHKAIKEERTSLRFKKFVAGLITIVVMFLITVVFKKKHKSKREG